MKENILISKKLTLINSISSVGTMVLNSIVALWLQQYLLKKVNPEEYSLIAVLNAVMVFMPLLSIVLTSGIGRYVIEALAKGDERRVTKIVSTMFPILIITALFVSFIGYFVVDNISLIIKIEPNQVENAKVMLTFMMFSFIIRLLLAPFSIGLYVQQKIVLQNSINFSAVLLRIILLTSLLYFVNTSVVWVIVAATLSEMISLFIITIISYKQLPMLRFHKKYFDWSLVKTLVSFGGWNIIGTLGSMIRNAADPLILNKFDTAIEVASFNLGSLANTEVRKIISTATNPLQPQITAFHAMDRSDKISDTSLRLGRYAMWASLIMIAPLLIYRNEIFQVYLQGKSSIYSSAPTVMALLLAYLPIAYSIHGLDYIVVATAKIKAYMIITSLSQILNLLLTFYFVVTLHMGAIGSALATLIAGSTVTLFAFLPLYLKMTDVKITDLIKNTIIPGLIPGIAGIVVWMIIRSFIQPSNWLKLGICFFSGMIAYIAVLYTWCLKPEDKKDFLAILTAVRLMLKRGKKRKDR